MTGENYLLKRGNIMMNREASSQHVRLQNRSAREVRIANYQSRSIKLLQLLNHDFKNKKN